jgi:GAF domain-containing protein
MPPLVLVVESDPGTQRLLQAMLARRGADVDVATSVEVAQRLVEHVDYSAAVVDAVSAAALLAFLKSGPSPLFDRTLALTTRMTDAPRTLRKPFEIAQLESAFDAILVDAPSSEPSLDRDFTRRSLLLGASSGVAMQLRIRTTVLLECVTSFGYPRAQIDDWFPLRADSNTPVAAAVRHARPLFFDSLSATAAEYPRLEPLLREHHGGALAAVPLQRAGRVVGAVSWSFGEVHPFDAREQLLLTSVAETFAHELAVTAERAC